MPNKRKREIEELRSLEFMEGDVPHILKSHDLLRLAYLRKKYRK